MKKRWKVLALVAVMVFLLGGCGDDNKDTGSKKEKENPSVESNYSPIVAEDVKIPNEEYPYMLKVNREMNCVNVYTLDDEGEYTVPVRAMLCSVGEDVEKGIFQIGTTEEWQMMADGTYGQYVTRIVDQVVFSSVPYAAEIEDSLNVDAFNHLGENVSGSSVALEAADAKWIADNCPEGTSVEVYEDEEAGPLGRPDNRLISGDITWDPTDEDTENAWYVPVSFFGIKDKTIAKGETIDLYEGVTAKDKYGTNLTSSVKVYGEVDVNETGEYKVTYSCENTDGKTREIERKIIVKEADNQETVATEAPVTEIPATPVPTLTVKPTKAPSNNIDKSQKVTVEKSDNIPPKAHLTGNTCDVKSLEKDYLMNRILVVDENSGVGDIYITVCPLSGTDMYVVIYEAFDKAGNSACVSEVVRLT